MYQEQNAIDMRKFMFVGFNLQGGRQSCQFSKPQQKMDLVPLRIISQQKFLVGA